MHAVRWENGWARDLGTLPDDLHSEALDINNAGAVVGTSAIDPPNEHPASQHAFIWTLEQGMVALATPEGGSSVARAINDANWVVGALKGEDGDRAARWGPNGERIDLNEVIDLSNSNFASLTLASDINALGDIVGQGIARDGTRHGFLLTVVPESETVIYVLVGFVAMVLFRIARQRRTALSARPFVLLTAQQVGRVITAT